MAAPSFVKAANAFFDASGTWFDVAPVWTSDVTVGNVVILQLLQDGTAAAPTITTWADVENLAGTDNAMTSIGSFDVGSAAAAKQHLWIGRATGTQPNVNTGANSGGDDLFWRWYEFSGVHTGTALSDVIENSSAGSAVNGAGTSNTVADTGVTTLGADRLALNFVAVNDDNPLDAFTGESGGDWTEAAAEYTESLGTDGAIGLQIATIASAGTINGGTDTMAASDAWGVVGFALIPAPSGPAEHFIASAENISPNIVTALGRETFISIPDDLGIGIVAALSRQTFIAAAQDHGPTIVVSLSPVEKVLAAAMDLGLVIDSALGRETFISATENYGPGIVTALSRETFVSLAHNLGVAIDSNLTVTSGAVEHFIAAAHNLGLTVDTALGRETFLATGMDLSPVIATAIGRETFIAVAEQLGVDVASRLLLTLMIASAVPLGNDVFSNLTIEGQDAGEYRSLLDVGL